MKKRIMTIVLTFASIAFLAACNSPSDLEFQDGTPLAIVIGRHANANMFTREDFGLVEGVPGLSDLQPVRDLIRNSLVIGWDEDARQRYARVDITVFFVQGHPINTVVRIPVEVTRGSKNNLEDGINDMIDHVLEQLTDPTRRATVPGADLLGTISAAYGHLNGRRGNNHDIEVNMLILSTGISTEGEFNMRIIDTQEGTPEYVVGQIAEGEIPRMPNTNVTFLGFGNTAHPQMPIRHSYGLWSQLQSVWMEIFRQAEATVQYIPLSPIAGTPMIWSEDNADSYLQVATVRFRDGLIAEPPEPGEIVGPPRTIVFDASDLLFEPFSAVFVDEDGALATILNEINRPRGKRDFLLTNNGARLFVVGSIAQLDYGVYFDSSQYSTDRANRVAGIIIGDGIYSGLVVPLDIGTRRFSWHNARTYPEFDENGRAITDNRQRMRVVAIISEGSSDYHELRNAGLIR